ncbi:MAG: SapC family protein [Pseudomonadota bacterium]
MTKQLMIYESVVPISIARHKDTSVKTGLTFEFAEDLNAVPLLASEFAAASGTFPIVFTSADPPMPLAVLGLRDQQNLFVDEDKSWSGRYTPNFLRQYPFVFAKSNDGERLTLCIDDAYEGVNAEGRGERLFDSEGERTQYLRNILEFAQAYQQDFAVTEAFCKRLAEHKLFDPMQAQVLVGTEMVTLQGFMAVSKDKLKQLDDEEVLSLFRIDGLELIYRHIASLGLFPSLADRISQNAPGPAKDDSAGKSESAASASEPADGPDDKAPLH